MERFVQAVMLIVIMAVSGYCQTLSKGDSALIGKRAYLRKPNTKDSEYFEFVDKSGKTIKRLPLGETITKKLSWKLNPKESDNEGGGVSYGSLINNTKDRLGIYKIKTILMDEAYYKKTGYCGIEKVDNVVYNETGKIVFQKNDVPYQLVKIADSGKAYCCVIPMSDEWIYYNQGSGDEEYNALPIFTPRETNDTMLKNTGKLFVFDAQGNLVYENYYPVIIGNSMYMAFSPSGEWFAYTEYCEGGGHLMNINNKKIYKIIDHRDVKMANLFNGFIAPFSKVSNDGRLMIRMGAKENRILYYNVQKDSYELGEIGSWIWGREDVQQ